VIYPTDEQRRRDARTQNEHLHQRVVDLRRELREVKAESARIVTEAKALAARAERARDTP
jgi:hypothetical protein